MGGTRATALGVACAIGMMGISTTARADASHVAIDWGKLLVGLDDYARHGTEVLSPQEHSDTADRPEHASKELPVQNYGVAWFGVAPSVTLVARDWGGAFRLAGDRLSIADALRMSRSSRMILSRVRLGDSHLARVTPFAQIGFGQWRTDSQYLPLGHDEEVAAQVGGGLEMRLLKGWQLAVETSATIFIRDEREAQNLPSTKLWSSSIASRIEW